MRRLTAYSPISRDIENVRGAEKVVAIDCSSSRSSSRAAALAVVEAEAEAVAPALERACRLRLLRFRGFDYSQIAAMILTTWDGMAIDSGIALPLSGS